MNEHLEKARDYIARGEEFYLAAATEIAAARDDGVTWVAIGDYLGRSDEWCKQVVAWANKSPANRNKSTPFAEQSGAVAKRHAKSVLRGSDAETLRSVLPDDEEQLARIAEAAYRRLEKKRSDERESTKQARRAVREEHSESPNETSYRMMKVEFGRVREALSSAIRISSDVTDWSSDGSDEQLLRAIATLRGLLDLTEQSIKQQREIDWDAELAALVGADS